MRFRGCAFMHFNFPAEDGPHGTAKVGIEIGDRRGHHGTRDFSMLAMNQAGDGGLWVKWAVCGFVAAIRWLELQNK